jgi:hypothetical protein
MSRSSSTLHHRTDLVKELLQGVGTSGAGGGTADDAARQRQVWWCVACRVRAQRA